MNITLPEKKSVDSIISTTISIKTFSNFLSSLSQQKFQSLCNRTETIAKTNRKMYVGYIIK